MAIVSLIMAGGALLLAGAMSLLSFPALIVSITSMVATAGLTAALVLFFLGVLAEFEVWRTLLPSGNHTVSDHIGRQKTSQTITKFIGKKKALVADDDVIVNRLLTKMLVQDGWEVVSVGNIEEAIKLVDPETSVAFVDVHMPGPKYTEGLRLLQEKIPNARLISFSSDMNSSVPNLVARAGADDFMKKPLDRADVLEQANQALLPR